MNALLTWARLDLRRRARSLALLAVLVALATATVATAVSGARRGSSVVDRLLERTKPATIAVLPNEPGFDWAEVAGLPGVEALARFPLSSYEVDGLPAEATDFVYQDREIMDAIERPVVLEGRLADPARDDEAVITANFEGRYGKGVGDTVTIRLLTPEQIDEGALGVSIPEATGPRIETRIVGVVRSPWFGDDPAVDGGRLFPSVGLFTRHEANLLGNDGLIFSNALVRLEGGGAAIPAFRERLAEVSGRRDIEFFDLVAMADHARDVGDFEADSLLAFALAAAVAAVFLVGQSVARYAAGSTTDIEVLRAFGMSPRHVRAGLAVGPTLAATIGAIAGATTSVLLSSRFPIGTVTPFEPDPGASFDGAVVLVALLLPPVLVGGGALLAAGRGTVGGTRRASTVASLAGRWGAPVSVLVGSRFALEPGRGNQAVPVRPALLGAAVGVVGVVAALTFGAGVSDATSNPGRFGQVYELEAALGFNDQDFAPTEDVLQVLADDPEVVAVNDTLQAVGEVGTVDVPVFAIDPVEEPLDLVLTEGRLPEGPGEMTLAPASMRALDARVGDTFDLVGTDGRGAHTVTGVAFVPTGSHNDYDTGAWVLRATYDDLFSGFKFHSAPVALAPGADAVAAGARIGAALVDLVGDSSAAELVRVMDPPSRMAELRQVRRLPLFLAAFLAVLAIGAVGHALATAVRRRRRDIAVLRTLGMTRGQCRWMIVTQASLLALFGLAVGVPTGLAIGRALWSTVAASTPVAHITPVSVWVLILIAPAALLIANLLAAWPSQRAAALRVGRVLRTE